jgi:hypothetical protein
LTGDFEPDKAKVFGVYPRKLNFGAEMFTQMNGFHPF